MSVARVNKLTSMSAGQSERHNERKNKNYENLNVVEERIPYNVSFKSPGDMSYNEYFNKLIDDGKISTRGLRDNATHFNEMIIDVNTEYFEQHGGYDFAKSFYEEAYRFCIGFYGEENIVSAVMHADEINKAVSEKLGKEVYHYHLHVVAIPTVEKEIKWSARCKDEKLRGTVREVIHQVSHSKKWVSNTPMLDENGNKVFTKNGKQMFVKSYSVLQDKLFEHLRNAGFVGFERGEKGSTAEHLSSLQYQIEKDTRRLADIEERVSETEERLSETQIRYEKKKELHKMYSEIDAAGKKSLGKYVLSKEDYTDLTELAKEGIYSRSTVEDLKEEVERVKSRNWDLQSRVNRLSERYHELEKEYHSLAQRFKALTDFCRPYIEAMKLFPDKVNAFFAKLLPEKSQQDEQARIIKPKQKDEEEKTEH